MEAAELNLNDVYVEARGVMHPSKLKLHKLGITWKDQKTGNIEHQGIADVQRAWLYERARNGCLRLLMKNGRNLKFDGIRDEEAGQVRTYFEKHYSSITKLERKEISVRGWNWGKPEFVGDHLEFEVNGQCAFELPLTNVANVEAAKNEAIIQFQQHDEAESAVSLYELRFYVPNTASGDDSQTAELCERIMSKAGVLTAQSGDVIVEFKDLQILTPRGRYDVRMYPSFMQMHGKSFDYKIPFDTVLRLFLLPHRDGRQIFFVINVDPPVRQGQTRYPFIVLLFARDKEVSVELNLTDEELSTRFASDKLQRSMQTNEYEIVMRVLKALSGRKVIFPGRFSGTAQAQGVTCNYKANIGLLYPLERGFIYVHKPPVFVRSDEIASVNFSRSSGSTRSFDFDIELKSGNTITFASIEKDEYGRLFDFVREHRLNVKNVSAAGSGAQPLSYAEHDDLAEDDSDDDKDAYLERMKLEGKTRAAGIDDDSDEDDADYRPEDEKKKPASASRSGSASGSGSGSGSDSGSGSESDSGASDSFLSVGAGGSDDEGAKAAKKKKKANDEGASRKKPNKKDDDETTTKKRSKKGKDESDVPKSKRTKRAQRDKDAPKRPPTAFFLWLDANRARIKQQNPSASVSDVARLAGERWKQLDSSEKERYTAMASERKKKYDEEMVAYRERKAKEPASESPPEPTTSKKQKKAAPKKEAVVSPKKEFTSKEIVTSSSDGLSSLSDDEPLAAKKKAAVKTKTQKRSPPPSASASDSESESATATSTDSD